jgi:hypothetical protein
MLRNRWILWLAFLLVIVGCAEPEATTRLLPTPTATVIATATSTPAILPTAIPTATVPPSPTPSPVTSRWQCHSSGGLACYRDLSFVSMLSPTEGWINNLEGTLLRYEVRPDNAFPTWQLIPRSDRTPFWKLEMVSPGEGWATWSKGVVHFKKGVWQEIPLGIGTSDLAMLGPDEGWAVTSRGLIFHYLNGNWEAVPSPTERDLHAIVMPNPDEGWASGYGVLLHYQGQRWEEVPFDNKRFNSYFFDDIEMINSTEGWIVGDTILHYQNGLFQEVTPLGLDEPLFPHNPLNALNMVSSTNR